MDDGTSGRRTCDVCGRPVQRNNTTGICTGLGMTTECRRVHAERRRRALGVKVKVKKVCGHPDGCPNPPTRNGFCIMHAARLNKNGELGPAGFINKPMVFMIGEVFGRWTVIENYDAADYRVLCRCECGTERRVVVGTLRNGRSQSCGCRHRAIVNRPRSTEPYLRAGEIFGRLTVLEHAKFAASLILVRCECGTETKKRATSIKMGNTKSCGCLNRENHQTHGMSGHPLWHTWTGMIARTSDPKAKNYGDYGGRGITACAGWQGKPAGFLAFIADVGERPDGCSLDRPDNDAGYFCGHCAECIGLGRPANWAWKTRREQNLNRRSVGRLTRERDALAARLAELERTLAAPGRKLTVSPAAQDALF